jgi:hypothetical protein
MTSERTFTVGDEIVTTFRPEKPIKVNDRMFEAAIRLRSALIVAAQAQSTLTYKQASAAIDGLYGYRSMGRVLDLVSEDCMQRGEPSLAGLVVAGQSGEVGDAFVGDAEASRQACYRYWR